MTCSVALRLTIGFRNAVSRNIAPRNTSSGALKFASQSIGDRTSLPIHSRLSTCQFACAVIFALALALVMAPQAALAQHGGGGGHAGGGGHIGGGGGGHVSSAPSTSSSSHASSASSSSSSSSARPAASYGSSAGTSLHGGSAMSATSSRSGGTGTSGGGSSTASGAALSAPRNVTIGFPPRAVGESGAGVGSGRAPRAHGGRVSFYGDGGAVWAEPSASGRSVARLAPGTGRAKATAFTSRAQIVITSSPSGDGAGDARHHPHRPIFSSSPTFSGGRNSGLFGGFFFGFDGDTSAAAGCDPTWSFGCDALADRIGNNLGYEDDAGAGGGNYSGDDSAAEAPRVDEKQITNTWVDPPQTAAHAPEEAAAEKTGAVLYMKNGSAYAVTNYWVAGGRVHYETSYGGNSVELRDLDFQRSVDANAARGADFTLRPAPAAEPKTGETQQPN